MKSKQFISLSLAAALACAPLTSAYAASFTFTDVTDDYKWAKDAIYHFVDKDIVGGIGDGLFAPESNITREQLAKILTLAFHLPKGNATFSDVASDKWSAGYIANVADLIVNDGKTFAPERPATREELAVSAVRALGLSDLKAESDGKNITDFNSITSALRNEVLLAVDLGIMGGYPDGSYKPQSPVTRAEAVVILNRALDAESKANDLIVKEALAKFGSGYTLASGLAAGDITNQLVTGLQSGPVSKDIVISFSEKEDSSSLFTIKDGRVLFSGNSTTSDKKATLTLTLKKGEATASKDVVITAAGVSSSFESYRYQFSYLTGQYKMNAFPENKLSLSLEFASVGDMHWYATEPIKEDRYNLASIIERKDGKPITLDTLPTGLVSAVVGDKGTLDKIYYTPSDMALSVQNGTDGAMITDLSNLQPNAGGADYTYYRASFRGIQNNILMFNRINAEGRAEVATVNGNTTVYSADPAKQILLKLSPEANIAILDGSVIDTTIKSAKRGSLSDLIPSTDGGENYVADFILNKDGEIVSLMFYKTSQKNIVTA